MRIKKKCHPSKARIDNEKVNASPATAEVQHWARGSTVNFRLGLHLLSASTLP